MAPSQGSVDINGKNFSATGQVLEIISTCPKPEHVTDDMPHIVVIKHVGDQCPWFSYKFMKTGRQSEIVINIIAKICIRRGLIIAEIIDDFYKMQTKRK